MTPTGIHYAFLCSKTVAVIMQVLVYGDCAVNVEPTAEELALIAVTSAETAAAFGVTPRVAMLSYSTGVSGAGPQVSQPADDTMHYADCLDHAVFAFRLDMAA